jgi:hypothetical protein
MKFHEYANLFPMLGKADLAKMADSIKTIGLEHPIIVFEDQILDGRNRFEACKIAEVDPRFKTYEGTDPLRYVIDHNMDARRHLTDSQRAMVGAKWAKLKAGNPNLIPPIGGIAQSETKTRDEASKLLGVGTSSIDRAKRVMRDAPELVEKIESGEMSVNAAYVTTKKPSEEAEPEPLVIDESKPTRRAPMRIIEDEGMNIWRLAKSHLDRINKNDTQREAALKECVAYCQKRLDSRK